jgi:hypothetical protein
MRQLLLSPRWLVRHLVAIALIVAFVLLGLWQLDRAEAGNKLSYAYTFEWPFFAAFVVFFWWRMLQMELHPPKPAEVVDDELQRPPPAPPVDPDEDPEMAAYNRYLASLYEKDRQSTR